jgi:predicted GNAT family N-acyltransferase
MIQGKLFSEDENLSEIYRIWDEVFLKEEKIPVDLIYKTNEKTKIHAIVYEGADLSCPIAAGRMAMDSISAKIELVAVLKEYRGKEYGDFVIRMLLDKAKTAGIQYIVVEPPESVVGFFQKTGFEESGEETDSQGIKYILMKYNQDTIKKCCNELKNV